MEKIRIAIIGLEPDEVTEIRNSLDIQFLAIHYDMLPKMRLRHGILYVEDKAVEGKFHKVDKVIFHGIFEDDFDLITLLALWNGPCLPNARGMMAFRKRIPGLVNALTVSKFGTMKRGMTLGADTVNAEQESVAKWGIWHCGEDKHKFTGEWETPETSVIEDFVKGEAVRIMVMGDRHWQIRLTGDDWLKSIHNEGSGEMSVDAELLEDSLSIMTHFGMEMAGVDYMVADNEKHLLEVNHIPNVTVFPFVREAFLEFAKLWIAK